MADQTGALEITGEHLGRALASLTEVVDSPQALRELIHDLGWELPETVAAIGLNASSVDAVLAALTTVLDKVQADGATAADYAELVRSVAVLANDLYALRQRIGTFIDASILAATGIAEELPKRLLDFLLVEHIRALNEPAFEVLRTLGIVELQSFAADAPTFRSTHVRRVIHFDRIPKLVTDPKALAREVYGWGTPGADLGRLIEQLFELAMALGLPARLGAPDLISEMNLSAPVTVSGDGIAERAELRLPIFHDEESAVAAEVGLTLYPVPPLNSSAAPGLALGPYISGAVAESLPLGTSGRWLLTLTSELDIHRGIALVLRPTEQIKILADISATVSTATGSLRAEIRRQGTADERVKLLAIDAQSGITAQALYLAAGVEIAAQPDLFIEFGTLDALVTIRPQGADSFLTQFLPSSVAGAGFTFAVRWSSIHGLHFKGSGGLAATFPANLALGPIVLRSVHLDLHTADTGVGIQLAASLDGQLGPLAVAVDTVGMELTVGFPPAGGNLGPVNIQSNLKTPSGVGLAINLPSISGGGFLFYDDAHHQYAGVLQLEVAGRIALTAIGLLTTRMPDGSPGYSLVVLITAQGFAPIELGYGFRLTGVGGLLGVNRTTDVAALRAGLRQGTLNSVLFPADPVRNAAQIVSDLARVFPAAHDRYLIGPMARITWGVPTLITIDLAILLELPDPVRLIALGRFRALLPDERHPLVRLQLDALGILDFGQQELSLDAILYDSRLLDFTLTGGMALRAGWGPNPHFVLAIGGLNPRFPVPAGFPQLDRIGISLANSTNLKLRLESYLALTSNSVQFGAHLDLLARVDPFSLEGHIGFDALFQLAPFQFVTDLSASVALKSGGQVLLSVALAATLSGPTPWHVQGWATFQILFFSASVRFDHEFGAATQPPLPEPVDVRALLVAALTDSRSWSGELPPSEHPLVTVTGTGSTGVLSVHPLAVLSVRERVVPLDVPISRFGSARPSGDTQFHLDAATADGRPFPVPTALTDAFARAQFQDMTDDQKLSAPAFETFGSGLRFGSAEPTYPTALVQESQIDFASVTHDPLMETPPLRASVPHLAALDLIDAAVQLGAAARAPIRTTGADRFRPAAIMARPVAAR